MEQLVARRAHNPKVVGSSPAPATNQKNRVYTLFFYFHLYNKKPPIIIVGGFLYYAAFKSSVLLSDVPLISSAVFIL